MTAVPSPFYGVARRRRRRVLLALAPVLLVLLFCAGYWPRYATQKRLAAESRTAVQQWPRVKVATAVAAPANRSLTLPGTLVASRQALVNARATGYVRVWNVDIGDQVRAGDVLAELETPELNQQLDQARAALNQKQAALEQAVANRDYARVTASRQDALFAEALVSRQTTDQSDAQLKIGEANVRAANADVAAAQANVRELAQLVSFGHVTAPFEGRVTQRNIDIGSLVMAGGASGASGASPLFRIEAIDPIRVFVQVPQTFALNVKDAQPASVSVRQLPGRVFEGQVTRTAGTLDPASRTLTVEIDVPNPTGELLGGMFAQVMLAVSLSHRVVRVPSSAVITDASGVHVAAVDSAGQVHLVTAVRGIDNGREIDLVEGLRGGERVMVNPGGGVADGMRVDPVGGT